MTKKPKKPRDRKTGYFVEDYYRGSYGYRLVFSDSDVFRGWRKSTKELEDLHRWLGDCIRYIKYRQGKKWKRT